ncbi:hypothetical protein CAP31_05700 [Sulfuriferula sp. AH1]|uniref:serine/threonine protein kinase n=1 Tax=Sulfuriferula sp. AH1 TaxID=1985873 RepID=UPI000B3BA406|nr:serine/threonine-protein kinase [Sulfuriferula sp. AH1]ARU31224.1 hypothetical protein CAP31_05700 [Sulfuriferula sp. AH1]
MPTEKLGRYEILSELGQGAMGIVYKAIDPLIERTVAIKTIKLDLSREELANFEERFYREAKSAGRLNHPNIVTIYDAGKTDSAAYMAMEFLEGQLLREILDAHTALSIDKIVHIAAQVADGLAYAHENGVVHRDIKPANIMLVRDGVAKIMDFGIAQMPTGSRTRAGTVIGSPKYMAPEQIIGKPVDGRSDLFALGVILYEMLTGESPFDGDNINTIMYRILNTTPVPPKSLTPRIPDTFNYIITKALAKEPDERYQNAKELANDLRNHSNLVIPEAEAKALGQHKTLDRRSKPRSARGEETVLLSKRPDDNNTINSHTHAIQANTTQRHFHAPFFGLNKKALIIASIILVPAIAITLMPHKNTQQQNIRPAQAVTVAANPINIKPAAANSVSAPIPPIVAEPAVTKKEPVSTSAPHRTELTHQHARKIKTAKSTSPVTQPSQHNDNALVSFAILPWGTIYIDGKEMGVSPPLKKLTVAAGKHKIEIRNLNFTPYSETLELKAESTKYIKYTFK